MLEYLVLHSRFERGTYGILTAQLCWLVQYCTVQYTYSRVHCSRVQYSFLYLKYMYSDTSAND